MLTRALPLYYSFLNLVRGFLALREQVQSRKAHGLQFQQSTDLLGAGATIAKGTFADFLDKVGATYKLGTTLTLLDCLSRIPEIRIDFDSSRRGHTNVAVVIVDAKMSGNVSLEVRCASQENEFRAKWTSWLGRLASECSLEPSGKVLEVLPGIDTSSYQAIAAFCARNLHMNLTWSDRPLWFYILEKDQALVLPRSAYYLIAAYILGSVVRYEPELIFEASSPDSELGWFLKRFLDAAERYYPQLMLNWIYTDPVFF